MGGARTGPTGAGVLLAACSTSAHIAANSGAATLVPPTEPTERPNGAFVTSETPVVTSPSSDTSGWLRVVHFWPAIVAS